MFARRTLLRAAPRLAAAPVRSLHASRPALADAAVFKSGNVAESKAFKEISRSNVHVLDSATLNTWVEIPKGGIHGSDRKAAIWSIWYNHAIVPLYGVSIIAASLCSWFMYRYFARHTEIAWSKSLRAEYDHQGLDESKASSHDNRLLYPGMRSRNKRPVVMFPFNFRPTHEIIDKHKVEFAPEE